MNSALLVKVNRSNLTEREHFGFIVLVDKKGKVLTEIGNSNNSPIFLRSCAKPFQALPIITSGTYDRYNFILKELAICSASHSASKEHVETIKNILKKIELKETHLNCSSHEPIDKEEKEYLIKNSLIPSQFHNNCSGKHVGMLAVCKNNNWDLENYLDFKHPLQQEILDIVKKYCEINTKIELSIDNCSAPVYGIPLYKMGLGYLNLFLSEEGNLLKKAFKENPVMIGGIGKLDTSVILASDGRLIAKNGAEGLCVITNLKEELSLVVKIMDANNIARDFVVIESLKQLGWLNSKELRGSFIQQLFNTEIKTLNNNVIGKVYPIFNL